MIIIIIKSILAWLDPAVSNSIDTIHTNDIHVYTVNCTMYDVLHELMIDAVGREFKYTHIYMTYARKINTFQHAIEQLNRWKENSKQQ